MNICRCQAMGTVGHWAPIHWAGIVGTRGSSGQQQASASLMGTRHHQAAVTSGSGQGHQQVAGTVHQWRAAGTSGHWQSPAVPSGHWASHLSMLNGGCMLSVRNKILAQDTINRSGSHDIEQH